MAYCLVLPHKTVRAWDGDPATAPSVQAFPQVPVEQALADTYSTDAHFAPYYVLGKQRSPRLKGKALQRLAEQSERVLFSVGVLDVDCPVAHATNGEAPAEWRERVVQAVADLEQSEQCSVAYYHTRGGARILWRLPEPLQAQGYLQTLGFARTRALQYGLRADELRDWQRVYRLPFVVRDGQRQNLDARLDTLGVWKLPAPDLFDTYDSPDWEPFELPAHVGAGERHQTLIKLAASLRAKEQDAGEIEAALREAAASFDPPYEGRELEAEVEGALTWALQLPPGRSSSVQASPPALQPPRPAQEPGDEEGPILLDRSSETSMARWIFDHWPRLIVSDQSDLLEYHDDKGVWLPAYRGDIADRLVELDVRGYYQGARGPLPLCVGAKTYRNVIDCMMHVAHVKEFATDAESGVAFSNGFLRVQADGQWSLEPHSPNNRATRWKEWAFDSSANPRKFLSMIGKIMSGDQKKIDCLCEFIGVAALGFSTRMQKALLLYGTGQNGKSQIFFTIEALFDPKELISVPPQQLGCEYKRYMFLHAVLNLISEVPAKKVWAEASAAFKAAATGDSWTARKIRESPISMKPRAGHIMSINEWFDVDDESDGMFRRWLVLNLREKFKGDDDVKDIGKLIAAEEASQIYNYCVMQGIEALKRGAYTEPTDSQETVQRWRVSQDPVAQWIEECMEVCSPDDGVQASEAYASYSVWAEQNGHDQITSNLFGRKLGRLDVQRKSKADAKYWGLRRTSGRLH